MLAAIIFGAFMGAIASALCIAELIEDRLSSRNAWRHIPFDDLHVAEMQQRRADFESECG